MSDGSSPPSPPELPFSPPIPRRRKKRQKRFPLFKAIWKSVCEGHPGPLAEHFGKEWRNLKRYPGILMLTVAFAGFAVWWTTKWWYFEVPYTGETEMKLFFPDTEGDPTEVSKSNIYRGAVMGAHMQATTPKDEKQVNVADVVFWQVNLIFDKEVDAENSVLEAKGLTTDVRLEIREFNRRSAFVAIIPAKPGAFPKGMLEISVKHRTANYHFVTQPSPTPNKEASPP
jgi:hypothetical protein